MKTKSTLKGLNTADSLASSEFGYLRMRTKQDTELIVTDYITPGTSNEYIFVCIQSCKFDTGEEEEEEGDKWIHYIRLKILILIICSLWTILLDGPWV